MPHCTRSGIRESSCDPYLLKKIALIFQTTFGQLNFEFREIAYFTDGTYQNWIHVVNVRNKIYI